MKKKWMYLHALIVSLFCGGIVYLSEGIDKGVRTFGYSFLIFLILMFLAEGWSIKK